MRDFFEPKHFLLDLASGAAFTAVILVFLGVAEGYELDQWIGFSIVWILTSPIIGLSMNMTRARDRKRDRPGMSRESATPRPWKHVRVLSAACVLFNFVLLSIVAVVKGEPLLVIVGLAVGLLTAFSFLLTWYLAPESYKESGWQW